MCRGSTVAPEIWVLRSFASSRSPLPVVSVVWGIWVLRRWVTSQGSVVPAVLVRVSVVSVVWGIWVLRRWVTSQGSVVPAVLVRG